MEDLTFIGEVIPSSVVTYPMKCWLCEAEIPGCEKAYLYWDGFEGKMILNCKLCHEDPIRVSRSRDRII